jgi:hypothetical protein
VEDVSIHLDTPADVMYHVKVLASMAGRISAVAEMAQTELRLQCAQYCQILFSSVNCCMIL